MEQNIKCIENIQEEIIQHEKTFGDLFALNKYIKVNKDNILYTNIRSLNSNFNKLEIFIENLEIKPYIVVCVETWKLECNNYFSLKGYKTYYNYSKLNKSDGVVVFIVDNINETTNIIEIGKLKILNSCIIMDNNEKLEVSALYRSHDLPIAEFIKNLKEYLDIKKRAKNHLIARDFNINLLELNNTTQEYLNNFFRRRLYTWISGHNKTI